LRASPHRADSLAKSSIFRPDAGEFVRSGGFFAASGRPKCANHQYKR
jgi:hypothetical protein